MAKSRSDPPNGIDRRAALRILGSAAATPLLASSAFGLAGYHPQVPAVESDRQWRPRFFEVKEIETVEELAEIIIPETDTAGARGALVHQYIDFALSRSQDAGETVRRGLAWLDERALELHGERFARLVNGDRIALVEALAAPDSTEERAGRRLFADMKRLTIRGYYRSEIGMHQELGYEGNRYLDRFEGCTHPEHRSWSPERPGKPE